MKLPPSFVTARDGVNVARALFEHAGWIVQPVDQQNDFGKDAYVDITKSGVVTPLCIALQIKSGASYRTSSGDYAVPVDGHATIWRRSPVPVFGIIYDPEDGLLRWTDLTRHLRDHPEQDGGSISVARNAVLNDMALHREFCAAALRYAVPEKDNAAANLLSTNEKVQRASVWDVWALGRYDVRYLILLRRLVLDLRGSAVGAAIALLSHAGDHPDILWTPLNWIPADVEKEARKTFRWSIEEIAHMFRGVHPDDWGRGTLGQCLDVLLYCDPDVVVKLRAAVGVLLAAGENELALRAVMVTLSHAHDPRTEIADLEAQFPSLLDLDFWEELAPYVKASGSYSIYV